MVHRPQKNLILNIGIIKTVQSNKWLEGEAVIDGRQGNFVESCCSSYTGVCHVGFSNFK
jgi:hypothetical protein